MIHTITIINNCFKYCYNKSNINSNRKQYRPSATVVDDDTVGQVGSHNEIMFHDERFKQTKVDENRSIQL